MDELIRERVVERLGMRGTQSHQTAVIPEPVLHAYTKERGAYEESTFWDPSWTLAKGSVMVTDIHDLATSARAIGKGELVSEKSHKEQVGPSLVGLGGPTKKCPESVCRKQWVEWRSLASGLGRKDEENAAGPWRLPLRNGLFAAPTMIEYRVTTNAARGLASPAALREWRSRSV